MASHDQVAHNWAHQTGRARKGFNVYYDGATIFSHGRHFPIARHTADASGSPVVLFTSRGYSISTSQHKSIVSRAINHRTVYVVDNVLASSAWEHGENHRLALARADEALAKAAKARTHGAFHLDDAERYINSANRYNAAFSLGLPKAELPANLDAIKARVAAARKAEREAERLKDKALEQAALQWVRGERDYAPRTSLPYVRVKGDTLQTSWGATVPLVDALPLYHLAERAAQSGKVMLPRGATIGHYPVTRIDADGTTHVGCHTLTLDRMHLAAVRLLPVVIAHA